MGVFSPAIAVPYCFEKWRPKPASLSRIIEAIKDRRHPSYVAHSVADLVKQRVFQIACGYEDANDCDALCSDPGFKAACGRLPLQGEDLSSQPTMSRFENQMSRSDLYRIARAFVDAFIASYKKPPPGDHLRYR